MSFVSESHDTVDSSHSCYFAFNDFIPHLVADLTGIIQLFKPVELCSHTLRIHMFLRPSPLVVNSVSVSLLNHDVVTYLLTTRHPELFGMNLYRISYQSSSVCFFYLDFLKILYISSEQMNRCHSLFCNYRLFYIV